MHFGNIEDHLYQQIIAANRETTALRGTPQLKEIMVFQFSKINNIFEMLCRQNKSYQILLINKD